MIGIEEVFEARTAPSGRISSARRKTSVLHVRVLDHGLDQQVGRHEVVGRLHAPEHLVGVGAALLRELLEARAHGREPALGRPGSGVVERDAPPRGRDDLRDPAAHLAGPDDEDVLEVHAARRL